MGKMFYIIQMGEVTLLKKHNDDQMKLCILGKGALVGEEIVINDSGCYDFTSYVTSPTVNLIIIKKPDFLGKFPSECMQ